MDIKFFPLFFYIPYTFLYICEIFLGVVVVEKEREKRKMALGLEID
jgi:hypothetical protein